MSIFYVFEETVSPVTNGDMKPHIGKKKRGLGMVTHTSPGLWEVKVGGSLEARSSRPAWPTGWNPVSTKNTKISQVWQLMPVIPTTQEAEARDSLEPRKWRFKWAKIMPLHHCTPVGETEQNYVYCGTVHNSKDLEPTQMPINDRLNKENVAHIYHGLLCSHIKGWIHVLCRDMNKTGNHHSQQTNTITENQTPHVLTHKWMLNNDNTWTQGGEHHTLGSVGGGSGRDSGGGGGEG